MSSKRQLSPLTFGIALMLMSIITVVVLSLMQPPQTATLQYGDPIYVRGDEIIKIRQIRTQPYIGIQIESDYSVAFYFLDSVPGEFSVIALSEGEKQEIANLREEWCTSLHRLPLNMKDDTVEIGVRCSNSTFDYSVTQGNIAIAQLPLVIQALLHQDSKK